MPSPWLQSWFLVISILHYVPLLRVWIPFVGAALIAGSLVWIWLKVMRPLSIKARSMSVVVGVILVVVVHQLVEHVWHPVAEGLGRVTWLWASPALVAAVMVFAGLTRRKQWLRRFCAALCAWLLIAVGAALGINYHFEAYPTMAEVVGGGVRTISWDELKNPDEEARSARVAEGAVVRVDIPSSDSVFKPRQALVYLPPSYFADPQATLPVITLLTGQPGTPQDWLVLGKLPQTMEQFAASRGGRAPIVAVVDAFGSQTANPLCSDTSHGKVASYLEVDVPKWLRENFPVSTDAGQWAIAGLSSGGTCALQVATRAPQTYRSFLDMSGEAHPQLGNEERTISEGFDGSRELYAANDPVQVMKTRRYDATAGIISWGSDDTSFKEGLIEVDEAAQASGMKVETRSYPGGHSWKVWKAAFEDQLPWLAERFGL